MAFDPKKFSPGMIAAFEQLLQKAYDQGVQDGIDRIVQAARNPISSSTDNDIRVPDEEIRQRLEVQRAVSSRRAPRGLVPKVVGQMLSDHPGKIIAEYEQMVADYDSRVSEKSVGNELRRHESRKYRRNDNGEWFPMSGNKEAGEGQQTNSPASDTQTQGERYGTALDL